jgi:hypothetical protein
MPFRFIGSPTRTLVSQNEYFLSFSGGGGFEDLGFGSHIVVMGAGFHDDHSVSPLLMKSQ